MSAALRGSQHAGLDRQPLVEFGNDRPHTIFSTVYIYSTRNATNTTHTAQTAQAVKLRFADDLGAAFFPDASATHIPRARYNIYHGMCNQELNGGLWFVPLIDIIDIKRSLHFRTKLVHLHLHFSEKNYNYFYFRGIISLTATFSIVFLGVRRPRSTHHNAWIFRGESAFPARRVTPHAYARTSTNQVYCCSVVSTCTYAGGGSSLPHSQPLNTNNTNNNERHSHTHVPVCTFLISPHHHTHASDPRLLSQRCTAVPDCPGPGV